MTEQKDRELYRWLRLIREFEDRVSALDKQGKLMGGVYSGKGQEAVTVGFCHDLRWDDWIFPLHRDLGAFLVKGADPKRLMAQIFGKRDGFAKGKDSYLHGGTCPTGSSGDVVPRRDVTGRGGMAYKFKIRKETAWRSLSSARGRAAGGRPRVDELRRRAQAPRDLRLREQLLRLLHPERVAVRGRQRGGPRRGLRFQGRGGERERPPCRDEDCREGDRPRAQGDGPTLVECKTYRYHGHSEHDRADYRSEEEVITWESRDPIFMWENYLEKRKYDIAAIRKETSEEVTRIVEEAVAFAEGSPSPEGHEAMEDLYAMPIDTEAR